MFGNRLKQLRKNNNKTQEDISKILGISRGAYS
ncbi:XRE family transcriptional regulator, partial [Listeria monocytogenes]|nr:XRE family transcriptional regulator [Listeria monocytogenes]